MAPLDHVNGTGGSWWALPVVVVCVAAGCVQLWRIRHQLREEVKR